jgi:hypothetical protein
MIQTTYRKHVAYGNYHLALRFNNTYDVSECMCECMYGEYYISIC